MNKKLVFALLASGLIFAAGCAEDTATPAPERNVVLWKQVKNPAPGEEQLNKEVHKELSLSGTPEEQAALFINLLSKQTANSALLPTVPSDVKLLKAEMKDHTLTLNFNDAVRHLQGTAEGVFIKSVNSTMVQAFSTSPDTQFKQLVYQINGKTVKTLVDGEFSCNKGELCFEPFLSQAKP